MKFCLLFILMIYLNYQLIPLMRNQLFLDTLDLQRYFFPSTLKLDHQGLVELIQLENNAYNPLKPALNASSVNIYRANKQAV